MENASRRFSSKKVKEQIECQREKYGWEFIFLAANIDAVETAENIGIDRDRAVNYYQDPQGIKKAYRTMDCAISSVRSSKSLDNGDWREEADDDIKGRGKTQK